MDGWKVVATDTPHHANVHVARVRTGCPLKVASCAWHLQDYYHHHHVKNHIDDYHNHHYNHKNNHDHCH